LRRTLARLIVFLPVRFLAATRLVFDFEVAFRAVLTAADFFADRLAEVVFFAGAFDFWGVGLALLGAPGAKPNTISTERMSAANLNIRYRSIYTAAMIFRAGARTTKNAPTLKS
jgi:hypothetical protein